MAGNTLWIVNKSQSFFSQLRHLYLGLEKPLYVITALGSAAGVVNYFKSTACTIALVGALQQDSKQGCVD